MIALDAGLKRKDLVVAGHHRDRREFEALGQMHRPDGDFFCRAFGRRRELRRPCPGEFHRGACAIHLCLGAHEDADLLRAIIIGR